MLWRFDMLDVFTPQKNTGSKHGLAKWTEAEVIALRLEYEAICLAQGKTRGAIAELARRHSNMSRQTIEFIVKRKMWKHC